MGLVSSGQQLAAGPVRDSPAEEEHICGMGLYRVDVMTWKTPAGRIAFPGPPAG